MNVFFKRGLFSTLSLLCLALLSTNMNAAWPSNSHYLSPFLEVTRRVFSRKINANPLEEQIANPLKTEANPLKEADKNLKSPGPEQRFTFYPEEIRESNLKQLAVNLKHQAAKKNPSQTLARPSLDPINPNTANSRQRWIDGDVPNRGQAHRKEGDADLFLKNESYC